MAIVNGIPGFTQSRKLNVLDQLRVRGTLISSPNTQIIESAADLPTPSGGTITLEDNTIYDFKGTATTISDYITYGTDSLICGDSPELSGFTYTGTGAAIRGVDVTIEAQDVFISHPNGDLIEHSSPSGNHAVFFNRINSSGLNVGSVGKQSGMVLDNCFLLAFDEGLAYDAGATSTLFLSSLSSIIALGVTSTALDFGDAVISSIRMNFSNILGTNISMSGAAASANVVDEAIVIGCKFTNTALDTITKKDLKWDFLGCSGIVSSTVYGAALMEGNATVTVLTQNTPTPVLGAFIEPGQAERTTTAASGVITANNIQNQTGTIFIAMSMTKGVGGGSPTILITVRKNGTDIPNARMSIVVTGNTAVASFVAPTDAISTDTFQVFLENITNNTDMTVGDMQFILSANGGL